MKIKLDFKKEQLIDIPLDNGSRSSVYAKLIEFDCITNFKFTIHEIEFPETKWVVSELSTGMKVCESHTKQKAINLAKNKLENHKDSFDSIIKKSKSKLKKEGFPFPINSI